MKFYNIRKDIRRVLANLGVHLLQPCLQGIYSIVEWVAMSAIADRWTGW